MNTIRKVKTAAINLATSLALALIAEGTIYLGLENPQWIPRRLEGTFREYYSSSDRTIIQVTECAKYDANLFYTLRPGSCQFCNREFDTGLYVNHLGFRDDDQSLNYPVAVALGDSFTMGWGVQQDESFPQVVEQLTKWKVLNAGMSSYGTARELISLSRVPLDSVKYIFLQYHANDFEENSEYIKGGFRLPIRGEGAYDSLRNTVEKRSNYFPFKHLYGISKVLARKIFHRASPTAMEGGEAQIFLQLVKQAGLNPAIEILVFKLDDGYSQTNDNFINSVDSLLLTPEFKNLNITTLKNGNDFQKEDYFILDDHFNKKGHQKIARKIHLQILSQSL